MGGNPQEVLAVLHAQERAAESRRKASFTSAEVCRVWAGRS
jgi:hypothetical protein